MSEAFLLVLACLLDWLLGDPQRWPHPVRAMGAAIAWLEPRLRAAFGDGPGLVWGGGLLIVFVAGGSWLCGAGLLLAAAWAFKPLFWLAWLVLGFQTLAAGQLYREAIRVCEPLDMGDLELARQRLSMIVGRETAQLSPDQVRRAVIETVAENFNDGVVAPMFYLALGGPALALAYKAVNTLDSMVGYKNPRYQHLGRWPARLDDLAGWLPARLSAILLALGAGLTGGAGKKAWANALAEHRLHKSPNSGWPEAAAAGALGLRLGGPNFYHGQLVEKPWLLAAGRDPEPADVSACLRMFAAASLLAAGLAACALLAVSLLF